jgi:hypothetical protein
MKKLLPAPVMKTLLTTTAVLAALTVQASAAEWWSPIRAPATSIFNPDAFMQCESGESPADYYKEIRNEGFNPIIKDRGNVVVILFNVVGPDGEKSPLGAVFYRDKEACEADVQNRQAASKSLDKYR